MFLVIVDGLALLLLFLNVVLLAAVHARRVRQYFRTRRAKRFRARVEEVFDEFDPATRARAPGWLRAQIGEFDELERPIAATMLVERMKAASEEERAQTRDVLRDAGVLDSLTRSSSRGPAWRRALAIRTLGWIGADESVPALLERLTDRSRHVRESAVRALGQIAEPTALPSLAELFLVFWRRLLATRLRPCAPLRPSRWGEWEASGFRRRSRARDARRAGNGSLRSDQRARLVRRSVWRQARRRRAARSRPRDRCSRG